MSGAEFAIAAVTVFLPAAALVLCGALSAAACAGAVLAAGLAALWLARKFARRLGGYTGDCLGAVQQLSEVAIYLAILATLGQGALA